MRTRVSPATQDRARAVNERIKEVKSLVNESQCYAAFDRLVPTVEAVAGVSPDLPFTKAVITLSKNLYATTAAFKRRCVRLTRKKGR